MNEKPYLHETIEKEGQQITRREALRIAQQILENAEKERIEHIEEEAKCGIQYND